MKFNMTTLIDLKGEKKQENKKKQKEIAKGIKKFKTHSFLSKVQLWITNYLLTRANTLKQIFSSIYRKTQIICFSSTMVHSTSKQRSWNLERERNVYLLII